MTHFRVRLIGSLRSKIDVMSNFINRRTHLLNGRHNRAVKSVEQSGMVQASLQQILLAIRDIKDRATQIATAAEEQAAVSNEITKSVSSIGDSAQQSADGSHEMAKAGEHQAKLARDLSDIARSFRT